MSEHTSCDYCHLPIARIRRAPAAQDTQGPVYCCYGCSLAAAITQSRGEAGQVNWMLTRLGAAMFLTMALMMITPYLYGQDLYATSEDMASPLWGHLRGLLRYLSLIFATPVFLVLGLPIASNALAQWRRGIASTDALVILGVGAAFVYSYVSTLADRGGVYYEPACVILVLITLGRWMEAHGKWKASDAVKKLHALVPDEVAVEREGRTASIRSGDVRIGDRLLVPAGASIAADGVIEEGRGYVDEQLLTGESAPVLREAGDLVRAGTLSCDGALKVRVTAVGDESTLGRLIALLEAARQSKGYYERLADRVSRVFVPLTLALAAVAALIGWSSHGTERAVMSALAVMLIACPCALGIATPTAIWVSLGRAARGGVLFRNGEAIEKLALARAVCFDKTGTLTTGEPRVASIQVERSAPGGEGALLALAAGLAVRSAHVLSRSLTAFAADRGIVPAEVTDVMTIPGRGLTGLVDAKTICLGSAALMHERGLRMSEELSQAVDGAIAQGQSLACVGAGRKVLGVFTFSESLRAGAGAALEQLRHMGVHVAVLTGDHAGRARAIGEALNATVYAGLLPGDKIERIREIARSHGPVAMVGDGLNDAPALAAADVGMAMGCGADVARESADVCLLGNDPAVLPATIALARKTVHTIRLNLFFAFAYNVIGIGLAMFGRLSPVFAAAVMVVSSLFVVTNSLRLGADPGSTEQASRPARDGRAVVEAEHGREPHTASPMLAGQTESL